MFKRPFALTVAGSVLILLLPAVPAAAEPAESQPVDQQTERILDMDIEQLSRTDVVVPSMDIEVTSVAKQESTVGRSPAAVFVISSQMISRSTANSIPELLRMVPGLEVARIDSSTWAITSRGFNAPFANKLLVLIDGRTVYTPLFLGGVQWDVQDLLLEDVQRIEVIRGPGGTLWGANAVNGVINVITKKAKDTQGILVTSSVGTEDLSTNGMRCGGQIDEGVYWRVYGKHLERGRGYDVDGAADDGRVGRGGFRLDWELDRHETDTLTVQGDYYGGEFGHSRAIPDPAAPFYRSVSDNDSVAGANVLARFTHVNDEDSDWTLQTYFDQTYRQSSYLQRELNTLDIDFQQRFPLGDCHAVIWGLGYRQSSDDMPWPAFEVRFSPTSRTTDLFSAFLQDQITLIDDSLFLTLGTKLEENDYTGFEYQPSARLLWTPDRRRSAWAAISRAVHTPTRFEHDGMYTLGHRMTPVPFFVRVTGDRSLQSEELVAYELGFRTQATERFSWDVAAFYNVYENLVNGLTRLDLAYIEAGNLIVPTLSANGLRGHTYGFELAGQYAVSDAWRLSASYGFRQMQLHTASGHETGFEREFEKKSPHNQARLYSSWDLSPEWQFDLGLRYVDELAARAPNYFTMDARLGFHPTKNFELAVVGQNLLDNHHMEFGDDAGANFTLSTAVQRAVFARATWRY